MILLEGPCPYCAFSFCCCKEERGPLRFLILKVCGVFCYINCAYSSSSNFVAAAVVVAAVVVVVAVLVVVAAAVAAAVIAVVVVVVAVIAVAVVNAAADYPAASTLHTAVSAAWLSKVYR